MTAAQFLLSAVGAIGLAVGLALAAWWAIQVLGVAITRRLPDPHADLARIGCVQKFSGFNPRPLMVYRQRCIAAEIERLQDHKRHLDAALAPPARSALPITELRRVRAGGTP